MDFVPIDGDAKVVALSALRLFCNLSVPVPFGLSCAFLAENFEVTLCFEASGDLSWRRS